MPIFYPVSEFFESSGNAAAEFTEGIRDQIAMHACNIWELYPDFFTQGTNPISSFARGFMNQACSPLQTAVPAPTRNFLGGQCIDAPYVIDYTVSLTDNLGNVTTQNLGTTAIGRIISVEMVTPDTGVDQRPRVIVVDNVPSAERVRVVSIFGNPTVSATLDSVTVTRTDGLPDDCGDIPRTYPPNPPSQPDLSTDIVIFNLDGDDNTYNLEWNRTNTAYNFPMNFKLNGTNVRFDMSGITIFGDLTIDTVNTGNDSPPPGSDGGEDVDGNEYTTTYPETEYPTTTTPALIEPVNGVIDYVVCNEGVLEAIQESIKLVPNLFPTVKVLLLLLSEILSDLCVAEGSEIGFPEVYPVLPGVERPALVFYFKEFDGETRLRPTYTSTVSNPSSSAVADFDNLVAPDKIMGKYVVALKLTDGSRIISSGLTETDAIASYTYLLGLTNPSLIPPNQDELRSVTFRDILEEREVKCTQVEYYPDGKQQGVSPALVKTIDPFA